MSNYIGQTIINTTDDIRNVQHDFSNFTAFNNVLIVYAAAVCIGFATKEMIADLMNEAVYPLLLFLTKNSITGYLFKKTLEKVKHNPTLYIILHKLGAIFWIIFVWIIILWLTYFIFTKLIKIDLVTDKVNIIQDIIKYITKQEKPYKIKQEDDINK